MDFHKAIHKHLHHKSHTRRTFWIVLLSLLITTIHCEQIIANAQLLSNYNVEKNTYNFWLYLPEGYEQSAHDTPLIIFLHGRSLSGSDLNRVRRYGLIDVVESGRKVDAMIVAPQCPSGASWQPQKIHNTIEWIKQHYDFDTNRIYVVGMSLGGYGTIDYCATYPEEVAAGIGMCGGASVKPSVQQNLSQMPFWILHGTADRAVPISESKKVVENVQDSHDGDKRLRYTWLQGGNHGTPSHVFYKKETYDWLFSHTLTDRGRPVNRSIDFTTESLKGAYKSMARGVVDVEINHNKKVNNIKHKTPYTGNEENHGEVAKDSQYDDVDDIYSLPTPEELNSTQSPSKREKFKSNKIKTNENYERHNEKQTDSSKTDDDAEERSLRASKRRDSAYDKRDKTPSAQVAEVKNATPIKKISTQKQGEKRPSQKDNQSTSPIQDKKNGKIIIVRSGDTLAQIARAYGTTIKQICSDNGIKETDILRLGQELRITKRRKTE